MKMKRILIALVLVAVLVLSSFTSVFAAATSYTNRTVSGVNTKYVTVDVPSNVLRPIILNAQNKMTATESLSSMGRRTGAVAAINGTYFEAYGGVPVPWGAIIKDGKVIHSGSTGSVFGITTTGKLMVDRLKFNFEIYVNDSHRGTAWRINHPSTENEAITIFTPEYGSTVTVKSGARAILVNNQGTVTKIATANCTVPSGGFVIVYNPGVAHLATSRFAVGDEVTYDSEIKTTFTSRSSWNDVVVGLGAGPSLIINGTITANGTAEGFTEAKINTQRAPRSFIGVGSNGKVVMGNMASATLKEAANACKAMGLVNAMCLDGGGSIALYHPSSGVYTAGRNISNGLGWISKNKSTVYAQPTPSEVFVNGKSVGFTAYKIGGNNYFKVRDLAMALNGSEKQFNVDWSKADNAILLNANTPYSSVGGELAKNYNKAFILTQKTKSSISLDGTKISLDAYNIKNNNYFKLRDIGKLFDFSVEWVASTNSIVIDTSKSYE